MPSVASMILRASREAAPSAASAASRCAAAVARSSSGGAPASDPLMRGSSVAAAAARGHLPFSGVRAPIAARPSGSSPSHGSGSTTTTTPPPDRARIAAPPSGSSPSYGSGSTTTTPPPDRSPIAAPPSWSSPPYGSGSTISTPPPFDMDDELPWPTKGRAEFVADEKDLESDEALWALYERWCKEFNQVRDRDEMAQRFSKFKDTVLRVQQNKKAGLPYTLEINQFADRKLIDLYRPAVPIREYVRRMPYSDSVMYGRAPDYSYKENLKRRNCGNLKSICMKNLQDSMNN